jgi:hypothetical protein
MSDFLRSLVARQLGGAETVRPRLAGRFEPPPDAFAPEAFPRAEGWGGPDAETLELSVEVETRPARPRDDATTRVVHEATRESAPRPEPSDAPAPFVEAPREESRPPLSRERRPAQVSEPAPDATPAARLDERREEQATPAPPARAETRAAARAGEEGVAPVRPKSIVPAPAEEAARRADEVARRADEAAREARAQTVPGVEEAAPFKPAVQARVREPEEDEGPREQAVRTADESRPFAPLVIRARARGERRETSAPEQREPSRQMSDDAERPAARATTAQTSPPAPLEDARATRAPEASATLKRIEPAHMHEPAHTHEPARAAEGEAESPAPRSTRRVGQEQAAFAQPASRRGARQAAAREAARPRAEAAPTINVTIGRVEVRATQAPTPAPRRAEASAPRLSLDDYLRRRSGEVRE